MTISRKKLLNGLRDHELFKQRDWELVALSAEEILENRLDGMDMTGRIVKSSRPMPPWLTKREREVFGGSMRRVKGITGHKRFLQRMESLVRRTRWDGSEDYRDSMEDKRSDIEIRIGNRLNSVCLYGLHYHQSSFWLDTVDLKKLEIRLRLTGYLAHPKFDRKGAECMVTIPITRSGQIVRKIRWTNHPNPEALEKKLFSSRDWELGAYGKITKREDMPNELTPEELKHAWIGLRQAETSKRGKYVAFLQSLETPQARRIEAFHGWLAEKAENGMLALCGYALWHHGWGMRIVPSDINLLDEGDDPLVARVEVKSHILVATLDSRGKMRSLGLMDNTTKDEVG